jgi:hypothetical protein
VIAMHGVSIAPRIVRKHGRTFFFFFYVRRETPKNDRDAAFVSVLFFRQRVNCVLPLDVDISAKRK